MNLIGKKAITTDMRHQGTIIKQFIPTGMKRECVHIKEDNGEIYYCPVDEIWLGEDE